VTNSAAGLLSSIARGRLAWSRVASLLDSGHDAGALLELYPDRVVFWELSRGRAVTLTPLAAAELGVHIRDEREGRRLFWDSDAPTWCPKVTTRRGEVAIPIPEWPRYAPSSPDPAAWQNEDEAEAAELERRRPRPALVGARILGVIVTEDKRAKRRRKTR